MHKKFNHEEIEKKWQQIWKEQGIYNVGERDTSKEKEYVLVEWPYPSGNLHIGHWFAFAVVDIYVRARRMQGKQVLFPIGFDAFGLPAENAAIKRNLDPKEWTESNIAYMTTQLESMGNAFSWDKTTSSTDPEYYKWTQWMFTEFFKNDIAFRGTGVVNWCPGCNTVIANEQVLSDNTCERSGDTIEKRQMPQWMLRITQYADRLIDDLDGLDWPEHIKEAQRQWIGRSQGAELTFTLSTGDTINIFTTRPDTLFGATYMVLAPEHPWIAGELKKNGSPITNATEIAEYIKIAREKSEIERTNNTKEKTGVEIMGVKAINPANGEEIPVFVADYVLAGYGTGAIMAVPAHDERDFEFAKTFNLPIVSTIVDPRAGEATHVGAIIITTDDKILFQRKTSTHPNNPNKLAFFGGKIESNESNYEALVRELHEELELDITKFGINTRYISLIRSGESGEYLTATYIVDGVNAKNLVLHEGESIVTISHINELSQHDCTENLLGLSKINFSHLYAELGILENSGEFDGMSSEEAKKAITEKVGGKLTNTYRLRDWSIGRQRYWGVPIPIVYDPEGNPHPIPKEHLPWILPNDVDFKPTGEAPLAKSKELKDRVEKIFGKGWTPEVETMDTFVDSSWYFLRYLDAHNEEELSSKVAQNTWMPIDIYFGGAEHTTMHLLYSRFWQKALFDIGVVAHNEPYKKRINRGLVLGPDGNKMSKSKGNVIDPDEHVKRLGADTVKMYLAFMGPYGDGTSYPWDMGGIAGQRRFLERIYGLGDHLHEKETEETSRLLNKTIQKVTSDLNLYKFNTAISACMIFLNHVERVGLSKESYFTFLQLLAPFAPHLTEELWHEAGKEGSIHESSWPSVNEELLHSEVVTISVQIRGKMRGTIEVRTNATKEEVLEIVKNNADLSHKIDTPIVNVFFVPGKVINLVLE